MSRRLHYARCAAREPSWVRLSNRRLPGVAVPMHAWLNDPGSLTRSVTGRCRGCFQVDVVDQRRVRVLPSEAVLIGTERARPAFVREVRLRCGDEAWVFARTVLPLRGLSGPVRALTSLGRRPLGEVLFSDPTTRRLQVEMALIRPGQQLFSSATAHLAQRPATLAGRRTLFDYRGHRILVNELFLPPIPVLRS